MTDAEKAYAAAERMIAEAKKTGEEHLDFDTPKTRALTHLPPQIAELAEMKILELSNTQITDAVLAQISGLTGLEALFLGNTQITDAGLAQINGLTGLETLDLDNTQITDAGLAQISGLTGLQTLLLSNTQITDAGLAQISGLTGLKRLTLSNTEITDAGLAQISGLTGLDWLDLENTPIKDLRLLRGFEKLATDSGFWGLEIKGTAAARADARIAEIAEIEDAKTRARALFDLIDAGWVPPTSSLAEPTQDSLLQIGIIDDKLELPDTPPTEAEQAERLKRVLHERLQARANDLATASGNQFSRLTSKARILLTLVQKPFEELDLLSVHLELDVLEARRLSGVEDGQAFDEAVMLALEDVTRLGPGLTLDHPDVELMLARVRRAKDAPIPEAEDAARRALSAAIIADPEANGPKSRAMEERLAEMPDQAAAAVLREIKTRNTIWVIGSKMALFGAERAKALGDNVLSTIFGVGIAEFLKANWAVILAAAGIYAPWLAAALGVYFVGKGIKEEWDKRQPKH